MSDHPLLTHAHPRDVLAWSQGGAVTAAQFLADARRLAAAFPPGRHVINAASDRLRFAVGFAAALICDRISLLPPALTPEMVRQVRSFAPDVFCLTDHVQPAGVPLLHWSEAMAASGSTAAVAESAYDVPDIPAHRIAAIVFTSGSTGLPVAHRKTWGGLVRCVRAEASRLGLADGQRHSIVATVAPQHMYGFESTVLMALQSGAALSASHPFYPADICSALAQASRPRMLVTTPIHLKTLLAADLEIPPVDLVLCATAPMPPQLALAAEARLGVPLLEIYGSTESGQIASRRTSETAEWALFPGVALDVGPEGTWARGGHIDEPVVLADEIESLDARRFLLHGRTADLVNIAGKRSSLGYLNHQLNALPGVMDGVFFMPDENDAGGATTRLMAFVVAPGLSAAAVLAALRERVDRVFLPRPLVMLDALPRNSTGKLPRDRLHELASQHRRRGAADAQ